MGELINLTDRRSAGRSARGRRRRPLSVSFHFDLASPFTYLAAERVERLFPSVSWVPTRREIPDAQPGWAAVHALAVGAEAAEARARELKLPLVWPERGPMSVRRAMRVAACAAEQGRGAAFVLAASRLAFCGGFHLEDPSVLTEAAAAAGVSLHDCLQAARDVTRDAGMDRAGQAVAEAGGDRLPAVVIDGRVFAGEHRLPEAAAAFRAPGWARADPVPHAG